MASAERRKERTENAKGKSKAKNPSAKKYPGSAGNGMGKVTPKKKRMH